MTRAIASLCACAWLAVAGCSVEETHARCERKRDCASGEDCYLGYCVLAMRDAATSASSEAVKRSDAGTGLRRRGTPTLTGRGSSDANGIGLASEPCLSSEEDAGPGEGACCEQAVPCYEGPEGTLGQGRCKAGMRACEDGRLGVCEGSVLPAAESCKNQGADDDCDGVVDNVPELGEACSVETSEEACRQGVLTCVEGEAEPQCRPSSPPREQCNGRDDDCDTKVDESFDLMKDAQNCGACNVRCTDTQACCMGACVARAPSEDGCPECSDEMPCAEGRTCCAGGCVDVQSNENHCGACGNACSARQTCCAGKCVDTRSDEQNCGRCGNACRMGDSISCCAGNCVDLTSNRQHCGACGNSCGALCSCELEGGQPMCRGLFCL